MTEMIATNVATGLFESLPRGGGDLRNAARSFQPTATDVFVPPALVAANGLVNGAVVVGPAEPGQKGPQLKSVTTVCGIDPAAFRARKPLAQLLAINPESRFNLGNSGNPTMRIIDLFAPIARGTRGLIVSPPKAGKTQILEDLAKAIHADAPEARIVVLLIDERPEEVTNFRRQVPAEVIASNSDQSAADHVRLAELCLARARCEVECGHEIVILVDSLTRMGRAFNCAGEGSRRTLSGGLDSRALEIPRKFFGLARNVENGGSVTVIATALIETGSRMDDMIFEEFKGTGNSEVVLSRQLAESRVFPAIDLKASGTRHEELLLSPEELSCAYALRRRALDVPPKQAVEGLLELLKTWPTNAELVQAAVK
jgi:transcription termination factor Rho